MTLPPISRWFGAACAVGGRVGGDDDGNDGDAGEQSVTVAYPVSQSDCNQPVTQFDISESSMRGADRDSDLTPAHNLPSRPPPNRCRCQQQDLLPECMDILPYGHPRRLGGLVVTPPPPGVSSRRLVPSAGVRTTGK